jgi:excinuclease ABC subunit C
MNQLNFLAIQKTLPNEPGIYKYFDARKNLLYIGKAKNIRKRVSSYFTKNNQSFKTHELVKQIDKIEFTIVKTEHDALLLENALIKEFRPKYNIELKDDKTYPYIVIKNEPFPRVFLTRRKINDGSSYIGPFTSIKKLRELLSFIKINIPLRTCSLNLSQKNIEAKKFKVCLEYQLGNCKGPCVGYQSLENYDEGLKQIRHILKGNFNEIISHYKKRQLEHIEKLEFEEAQKLQYKIGNLKDYQSQSVIVNPALGNLDVFGLEFFEEKGIVSYLSVRNGTITNSKTLTFQEKIEEDKEDLLLQAIIHFQTLFGFDATEVIIPFPIDFNTANWKITVPKAGEKKKLLDLANANSRYFKEEAIKINMLHLEEKHGSKIALIEKVRVALSLKERPTHIECFDNSNFHGEYPVSAMVCFKDGMPCKSEYRKYNVQDVKGINDFATMKEAVYRRYHRLTEEQESVPQLVIIDGGKGQLGAAMEAIEELKLNGKMTLVGLAKKQEELFFYGDQESLKLPVNGEVMKFIRSIRDEVHRYGITFHRKKRSQGTFKNELENIKGIGKKTAQDLLLQFRSVNAIKKANKKELEKIVGESKANLIFTYFHE